MILTLRCKEIISDNLETFKSQINKLNMYNLNDNIYLLTQNILLSKYGNSWVRYKTAENFLNALNLRFANIAPIYSKKFDIINDMLETENKKFLESVKSFEEEKSNTIESSQNEHRREAETPTTIKASTDFIDKYTNNAIKAETSGSSEENGTITHEETDSNDIFNRINNLNKKFTMLFEEYSNEFSNLFQQFI